MLCTFVHFHVHAYIGYLPFIAKYVYTQLYIFIYLYIHLIYYITMLSLQAT